MQVIDVEQGTDEWKEERYGKITGTRLGDIYSARAWTKEDLVRALEEDGTIPFKKSASKSVLEDLITDDIRQELLAQSPRKKGFYEIIAERLGLPRDYEDRMERGLRLEVEAREWFEATYDKNVTEVGICVSDAHPRIINSPDGLIYNEQGVATEALEIKCLAPATHIQAVLENTIPDEYFSQKIQYFTVNDDLQRLYWVFYDPSIASVPHHVIEVTREELGDWPERMKEFQLMQLKQIEQIVTDLAF